MGIVEQSPADACCSCSSQTVIVRMLRSTLTHSIQQDASLCWASMLCLCRCELQAPK